MQSSRTTSERLSATRASYSSPPIGTSDQVGQTTSSPPKLGGVAARTKSEQAGWFLSEPPRPRFARAPLLTIGGDLVDSDRQGYAFWKIKSTEVLCLLWQISSLQFLQE